MVYIEDFANLKLFNFKGTVAYQILERKFGLDFIIEISKINGKPDIKYIVTDSPNLSNLFKNKRFKSFISYLKRLCEPDEIINVYGILYNVDGQLKFGWYLLQINDEYWNLDDTDNLLKNYTDLKLTMLDLTVVENRCKSSLKHTKHTLFKLLKFVFKYYEDVDSVFVIPSSHNQFTEDGKVIIYQVDRDSLKKLK